MTPVTGSDYNDFVASHPSLTAASVPPWGAVTIWNGRSILVYFAKQDDGSFVLHLTDVTDKPDVLANQPSTFDPATMSMWYYLPQEIMNTINKIPNPLDPNISVPWAIIVGGIVILVLVRR